MKQERRQPQQIFGYPDGYPNMVRFKKGHDGKWYWWINHQGRKIVEGTRGYSSKANAKRGFLSFLTHAFMLKN